MRAFSGLCLAGCALLAAQEAEPPRPRPLPAISKNVKTGPDKGAKVPEFELPDQLGQKRSLASLTGKNGLLVYFVRSADW